MTQTPGRNAPPSARPETGKLIVVPGLLMLITQVRAVVSFGTPGGMSAADVLAILVALCFTGAFGASWLEWRRRKLASGATNGRARWPLIAFTLLPLAFAGGYFYQWVDGPSPYSALKGSALTGCNLPGNEWRAAVGKVGVIEAPDGEIVFVYNVRRNHGEAVVRTRATPDPDYDWYASLVLDGRNPRATRVLCFEQNNHRSAVLRDIATGEPAGSSDETKALIDFANS